MIDEVLSKIYNESPHNWPYGLSRDMFKSGSLWEVKHAGNVVGFVGWQETRDGNRKVGYYSVGVLPEHRNKGYAKAALRQMLCKQAATVDEVRARITGSNESSLALSTSLSDMSKEAVDAGAVAHAIPPSVRKQLLMAVVGAIGGGPGVDNFVHGEGKNPIDTFKEGIQDPVRAHRMFWNSLMGAGAGVVGAHSAPTGVVVGLGIPTKDLVIKSTEKLDKIDTSKINRALDSSAAPKPSAWESIPKPALYAALGLGGLGAGMAGLGAYQKYRAAKAEEEAAGAGRVKITLPRKSDTAHETSLDLPISDINLTDALRQRLGRDTRRTLYAETRERTRHRRPKVPGKPTDNEITDEQLAAEEAALDKEACYRRIATLIKSGAAVPSPPQQGTNPAFAMTQQQQAMQAQPSRTQGNPDIASAQQQAQMEVAQAQQQAQQELAKVQQDAAAQTQQMQQDMASMQQQQGMELAKSKTENEVLKMKVAEAESKAKLMEHKHKMHTELLEHKHKAMTATPDESGDMATTRKLLDERIASIGKLMKKASAVPAPVPPAPATPPQHSIPTPPNQGIQPARPPTPGGLSDYNRRADQFIGQLWTPRQIYASSGSPMLDQFMHMGRQAMMQPSADWSPNPVEQAAKGADASDMLSQPSLARYYYNQMMSQVPTPAQ